MAIKEINIVISRQLTGHAFHFPDDLIGRQMQTLLRDYLVFPYKWEKRIYVTLVCVCVCWL